jgi:CBS-domain-containing membrane protein
VRRNSLPRSFELQDPVTTTLADICSHSVVTVTPTDSVEEAVRLMRTHAIRRLLVVSGGQAVGMVSFGDLAVERDPGSALGSFPPVGLCCLGVAVLAAGVLHLTARASATFLVQAAPRQGPTATE